MVGDGSRLLLRVGDLSKEFDVGGGNRVQALRAVGFDLGPGDLVSVVGANAAGKSTLFRILAGDMEPDTGKVEWFANGIARHLSPAERGRRVAHLTQVPLERAVGGLTIAENAILFARRGDTLACWGRGVTPARKQRLQAYLESFGLHVAQQLDRPIERVSGGQRQLLGLLLAVLGDQVTGSGEPPDLVLLDEPTSALDPENEERCYALVQEIHARLGAAVMMITHDLERALEIGQRVLVLRQGELVFDGSTAGLSLQELSELVFRVAPREG